MNTPTLVILALVAFAFAIGGALYLHHRKKARARGSTGAHAHI